MGFWLMFFISLAFTVVGELLRPKQKFDDAKPSALGDFSFPTADPSRVIPVFWGTCKLQGPNTAWFGDLDVVPINKKVKTGWFSSDVITQGHKYYLGVQLIWCWGQIDEFIDLLADDLPIDTTAVVDEGDYYSFSLNAPMHMGADEPTNGLTGSVKLYKGTTTQPVNAYLEGVWNEDETTPFPRLCYAALEHCYLGNSNTPPPIGMIARRTPNQLGVAGGKENVNGDANVPCACYEIMTDRIWGLKMDPNKIDKPSFIECANTLFDEGIGISMLVDNPMVARDLMADMLRHVDGVIYPDPVTGLYTMKLARKDYDVETLVEFNDSNIEAEGFEFSRMSWEETKNTIIVNYVDREQNFQVRPATYQDPANIDVRRGVIDSETIDFLGYSNPAAALAAAARASKTRSSPLVRAEFLTSRAGFDLRPGSVFKLTKTNYNISGLVMRAINVRYGTLDDPRIRVTCTEDIFAVNGLAFSPPQDSGWTPPIGDPDVLDNQALFEMPYHILGAEQRFIGTLASPASGVYLGYQTWQDPAGGSSYVQTGSVLAFTPTGEILTEYPDSTDAIDLTGFLVENGRFFDLLASVDNNGFNAGDNVALIRSSAGDEFVAWKTVAAESGGRRISNVMRGVYDTIPLTHPAPARVWFFTEGMGALSDTPYQTNTAVTAKLLPYNSRGALPLASASPMSLTPAQRAWKPYPPAGLAVDGSATEAGVTGNANVSWRVRHRTDQYVAGVVVSQDADDFSAAPEGLYEVKVYVGGVLKRTVEVAVAPWGYDYTPSMRVEDDADVSKTVQFGVTAKNGAFSSVERLTQHIYMLDALDPLTITTVSLPVGATGEPYSTQLVATGGVEPYEWTVFAGGPLPDGFTLSASGLLEGSSEVDVEHEFTVQVEGQAGTTDTQILTLRIAAGCEDYTVPAMTGATFDITEPEEVLPPSGNELHICNEII
jgi:hypothetical protein